MVLEPALPQARRVHISNGTQTLAVTELVNEAVEEANKRIAACEMRIARQLLSLVSQKVPGRDVSAGARLENLLENKAALVSYRDALLRLNHGD
jgi:hypothetical protein